MNSGEDHAVGLELQLIELVERRERASVQGRKSDAAAIQVEIDQLQTELAALSDLAASVDAGAEPAEGPVAFHDAVPADQTSPAA
ncbi:MAG TPA: hypothetical protein VFA11_16960 [Acidimicrobiales bacterium]|nr:hypothetical protein [Acidimicrobiales bacterium]